jgi:hypothetical protein
LVGLNYLTRKINSKKMTEFRGTKTTITGEGITIVRTTYRARRPDHFWGAEYHKFRATRNGVDTVNAYHTKRQAIDRLKSMERSIEKSKTVTQ